MQQNLITLSWEISKWPKQKRLRDVPLNVLKFRIAKYVRILRKTCFILTDEWIYQYTLSLFCYFLKSYGINFLGKWLLILKPFNFSIYLTLLGSSFLGIKYSRESRINHAQCFLKYSPNFFEYLHSWNSTY